MKRPEFSQFNKREVIFMTGLWFSPLAVFTVATRTASKGPLGRKDIVLLENYNIANLKISANQ